MTTPPVPDVEPAPDCRDESVWAEACFAAVLRIGAYYRDPIYGVRLVLGVVSFLDGSVSYQLLDVDPTQFECGSVTYLPVDEPPRMMVETAPVVLGCQPQPSVSEIVQVRR